MEKKLSAFAPKKEKTARSSNSTHPSRWIALARNPSQRCGNGWRTKDPYLNKVAVWTYYQGSKREPGLDEGQTAVAYVPEKGWFWHIPQHNDMVSVGVVAEENISRATACASRNRFSNARSSEMHGSKIISPSASRSDLIISPANTRIIRAIAAAMGYCSSGMRLHFSIPCSAAV